MATTFENSFLVVTGFTRQAFVELERVIVAQEDIAPIAPLTRKFKFTVVRQVVRIINTFCDIWVLFCSWHNWVPPHELTFRVESIAGFQIFRHFSMLERDTTVIYLNDNVLCTGSDFFWNTVQHSKKWTTQMYGVSCSERKFRFYAFWNAFLVRSCKRFFEAIRLG